MQVLLVDPSEQVLPPGTDELLCETRWDVARADDYAHAADLAARDPVDAIILSAPVTCHGEPETNDDFETLLRVIESRRIAGVIVSDHPGDAPPDRGSLVDVVGRDITLAELRGRLATIERYHGMLQRLGGELDHMEQLSARLHEHFREVDQEMRLAGRLQRDFLPDTSEPIGNVRFATVYRPASWVSGDTFDVFRIDEEHTGFYIADAVGHGMAASLLTMFIKRAVVPKRLDGARYSIVSPSEVMASLNDTLAAQALPNCQFVTACYAVLNHRTLELEYARGGHPYPLVISGDGRITELKCAGGLLGLTAGEVFPTQVAQLREGDKLILHTDGLESLLEHVTAGKANAGGYDVLFAPHAQLPLRKMLASLEAVLDQEIGSLQPPDDITVVGMEILGSATPGEHS